MHDGAGLYLESPTAAFEILERQPGKRTARYSRPTYHSNSLNQKAFPHMRQEAVQWVSSLAALGFDDRHWKPTTATY
jgi:hypothetical protein